MLRKNAPEKSPEKPTQPDYATEADIERAKRIAYLLEMKYGWQIKTDQKSIQELAKAIRRTEPPKWPDAKPVARCKTREALQTEEATRLSREQRSVRERKPS